jgi:hypothetical protein
MRHKNRLLLDFVLYIVIAVGIVGLVGVTAAHDDYRTFSLSVFGLVTVALFGVLINDYRAYRRRLRMWVIIAVCLLVHLSVGIAAILRAERIQLVAFGVAYIAELPVMRSLLEYFLTPTPREVNHL